MISLNLIPPQVKHDYQMSERWHRWLQTIVIVTILILLGTVATGLIYLSMKDQAVSRHATLEKLQQTQLQSGGKDISTITQKVNTTIATLSSTLGTARSWGKDTATITTGLPNTLTISSISLQANGQWIVVGLADTRQAFIQLQTALQANTALTNVTTTSTASKRTAIPFTFSGTFKVSLIP